MSEDFETAVEAVIRAATNSILMAAWVAPDWPENDPRWRVLEIEPAPWQVNYVDSIAIEAKLRLQAMRVAAMNGMLERGEIRRPQLASALGVSLGELETMLRGS